MRILLLSDRFQNCPSAYSKLARDICFQLRDMGHKVAFLPMGYVKGWGEEVREGIHTYPAGDNAFSEDVAAEYYNDWRADIIMTLKDPWVFQRLQSEALNWVPFGIIDHDPVSEQITSRLGTAFKCIAPSRFAQRQLRRNSIDSFYIPHNLDTQTYRQLDKVKCKKLFHHQPDEFIVGIVAMNRVRKMIPRQMQGYARFLENNPDIKNAHLRLWTQLNPQQPPPELSMGVADVGVNLIPEIMNLGLNKEPNEIRWVDPKDYTKLLKKFGGLPEWTSENEQNMVTLYNSFNVVMECTGGEAVGMTKLEGHACGVPAITTDYAGAPEYLGAGYTIPYNRDDYIICDTPGVRRPLANVDKMAEALTKLYNSDWEKNARRARRFAERFDTKSVFESYWKPFMSECENELYPKLTKEGTSSWA